MAFTLTFLTVFIAAVILIFPLLVFLALLITIIGQIVGALEKWNKFDCLYWTFITATTVGYGDIRPLRRASRMLAILIVFIGIMFTGIIVAITVESARAAFDKHIEPSTLESINERL